MCYHFVNQSIQFHKVYCCLPTLSPAMFPKTSIWLSPKGLPMLSATSVDPTPTSFLALHVQIPSSLMSLFDMTRSLDRKPVPVFIAIRLSVGSWAPFFSHVTSSSGESRESTRHLIVTSRPGIKSQDGWENVMTGGRCCSVKRNSENLNRHLIYWYIRFSRTLTLFFL